jgi:elongation factor 1-beta
MAKAIVTLKIMPENPEQDLDAMQAACEEKIKSFVGDTERRFAREPVAFGLYAIKATFVYDEAKGDLEPLEEMLKTIRGVQNVEVFDLRRAIG